MSNIYSFVAGMLIAFAILVFAGDPDQPNDASTQPSPENGVALFRDIQTYEVRGIEGDSLFICGPHGERIMHIKAGSFLLSEPDGTDVQESGRGMGKV